MHSRQHSRPAGVRDGTSGCVAAVGLAVRGAWEGSGRRTPGVEKVGGAAHSRSVRPQQLLWQGQTVQAACLRGISAVQPVQPGVHAPPNPERGPGWRGCQLQGCS